MAVHPSGSGASWEEDVDSNQPHGLDYRYTNHVAKAVRLRMEKGHKAFGDSTAGGEHIPGGAGVLGMEITNAGGDITTPVASDGTYQGRGLVWAYDGSANAILFCSTAAAESTAATDFTVLKMNPALQYDSTATVDWSCVHSFGYDVSVLGALYVDSSVDISGQTHISGDLSVAGKAEFSSSIFDGSVDISQTLKCWSKSEFVNDVSMNAGLTVDGTVIADGTGHKFGGTKGIGLFFDPTAYAGGETVTFPNGFIVKFGEVALLNGATADTTVSFGTAFPNACVEAYAVSGSTNEATWDYQIAVHTLLTTGITVRSRIGTRHTPARWLAVGY